MVDCWLDDFRNYVTSQALDFPYKVSVDKNEQSRAFKTLFLQYAKTPSGKKNVFFQNIGLLNNNLVFMKISVYPYSTYNDSIQNRQ